jgi:hypothetical protein
MKRLMAGVCLLLGACDSAAVKGCEEFVQSRLQAPSSYKRIQVNEMNSPSSQTEMLALGKDRRLLAMEKEMGMADRPLTLHTVLVEYEAKNAFNASVRGQQACYFDGEDPIPGNVKIGVGRAQTHGSDQCCLM